MGNGVFAGVTARRKIIDEGALRKSPTTWEATTRREDILEVYGRVHYGESLRNSTLEFGVHGTDCGRSKDDVY